jgi:hypothetical protein
MSDLKKRLKLGATGAFPDGKLDKSDEGELRMAVSSGNGLVRIDFGKPVAWFAIPANHAKELAALLMRHAGGDIGKLPRLMRGEAASQQPS